MKGSIFALFSLYFRFAHRGEVLHINPAIRRGRFIAPTADLSAFDGCSDIPHHLLMGITCQEGLQ